MMLVMPALHIYKCLNPNCPDCQKGWFNGFTAMNSPTPECPTCRSIKLQDCGVPQRPPMTINSEARRITQHDEKTLRRIAEQQGATNLRNAPPPMASTDNKPKMRYQGLDVPMVGQSGACVNVPSMAQPLHGTWSGPGQGLPGTPKAALKGMTNVVAEHK